VGGRDRHAVFSYLYCPGLKSAATPGGIDQKNFPEFFQTGSVAEQFTTSRPDGSLNRRGKPPVTPLISA
jgi:hypothetical protein